ncbi:sulfur carrier protein ThiS [Deltaproteobacteria bacterium PRO3]|nr:sulfur carrier protein ThiS [Deltaproteobacteria bacterium PRO3]
MRDPQIRVFASYVVVFVAAVAINLEVVPHSEREKKRMSEGDEVEVFHAVGGG